MTDNQKKLLIFIEEYRQKNGIGPSYREIAEDIKVSSIRSVHIIVDALVKKQCLTVDLSSKFRSLRLTDDGRKAIGKNLIEVRFSKKFPSYQTSLPFTIRDTEASIPSNSSSISYKNSSLKTNGTTAADIKPDKSNSTVSDSTCQLNLFDGTSKKHQAIVNVQNSTINFPFHSLSIHRVDDLFKNNDYFIAVVVSFTLMKIFNEGILWFVILLSSLLLTKKINKYL